MKFFVRGQWLDHREKMEVRHPFDGSLVDTVPVATASDVEAALAGAVDGAAVMRKLPGYERFQILRRAADKMFAQQKELGRLISLEEGKTLAEGVFEAGRPPPAINCLAGPGGEIGNLLCRDERVRKISFTGSVEVGKQICSVAGLKRVTMELGSNSPLIILEDADLNKVADAVLATGYGNAGQVCISTQRVIALDRVYGDLLNLLQTKVSSLQTGNPLAEGTK